MKVFLSFVVTLALMSQLCDCFDLQGKGGGQPEYLSVPRFKDCLRSKKMGSATVWCVPLDKPAKCPSGSYQSLTIDPDLKFC
jgi:hypothetical protein